MSMDGFKKQMALIDLKSRREECKLMLGKLAEINQDTNAGWLHHRIKELTQQIEVIEGKRLTPKEQE